MSGQSEFSSSEIMAMLIAIKRDIQLKGDQTNNDISEIRGSVDNLGAQLESRVSETKSVIDQVATSLEGRFHESLAAQTEQQQQE